MPLPNCRPLLLFLLLAGTAAAWQDAPRAAAGSVVINEFEYDTVQDSVDSAWEWIELYNPGAEPVDLGGWRLSDNTASDTFPSRILPAGGLLVVAAGPAFYDNYPAYGGEILLLDGSVGGGLGNTEDRLVLRDAGGVIVDALSYGSDTTYLACTGYPCTGVAPGHSLERDPPGQDTDTPADLVDRQPPTPGLVQAPPPPGSPALVESFYYDGYALYDLDEAVRILNVSGTTLDLGGWRISKEPDAEGIAFPAGTILAAGQGAWVAWQAAAFEAQFGFKPDFETGDTDPLVTEMAGTWPRFANDGGRCLLFDAKGQLADALVYEGGAEVPGAWLGPALQPWTPSPYFGAQGQILYRKRAELTGLPLADSGTAADWAQEPDDWLAGRRVLYPGWDLEAFFTPARATETAHLTVAVGPDHLYETLRARLEQAQESIWIEAYTFESAALAQVLLERLAAGVEVILLLESGPVGGVLDAQRWICQQIEAAGGQVWFMGGGETPARYRFQHSKFLVIDGRLALVGSENLNPTGMPADDKSNGTAGRRGVLLGTDAPGVVARLQAVFLADLDPAHHGDLTTCAELPELCSGLPPLPEPDYTSYTVAFNQPLEIAGEMSFEVVQAPENSLRTEGSLLGLVGRAGPGDTVLVAQFYEHAVWGPAEGTPETDPNPRLEAYLDAARRGARVRILLNSHVFGDYQNENLETVALLQAAARAEGLDLEVRLGNPTLLGLHNKMVLVEVDGRGTIHAGSLNGSEVSSKVNREVALQVQSDAAYAYLRALFDHDWATVRWWAFVPLAMSGYGPPQPAGHLLVSEVYYAVAKEEEWVEIVNAAPATVDLSACKLGDAERPDVFEGMARFPAGATIPPYGVRVVAASAAAFRREYGRSPDYELYATDPAVPDMLPYAAWGTGEWHLANGGDQVLLLDALDRPVDVLVYGDAAYPGVVPHPGVSLYTHSLERYPALLDSGDCSLDFRDWPFPNPGQLPLAVAR
jgi:phosphatidylserine/phosphatidylglycerophosphate/cardiolipin synthase-like enzyme